MQYSGASIEDAMTQFARRLALSMPRMKCAGWNWNAGIDPELIRSKLDE
jgi:hypothetical protein